MANGFRYSYGPVPSRRLGKSLGINNIPVKACSYSCIYCQVGQTTQRISDRRVFYDPEDIFQDVQERLAKAKQAAERIDYLTFVPDGEPTLDVNLGQEIALLKALGIPVGVITNSSLLWRDDVRGALSRADWVSLKVDTVRDMNWHRINRPCKTIRLPLILDGMLAFAKSFNGELVTETMLVGGINDSADGMEEVADFLSRLQPSRAYLSIPIRPPAVKKVHSPDENTLNRTYQIFSRKVKAVEYLIGYEGNAFAFTGDAENDLLNITAVHPMREEAVGAFLSRAGASWEVVDRLAARGDIAEAKFGGHTFYLRKFTRNRKTPG